MNLLLTVLFGLLPVLSFGQSCETIDGKRMNCTDSLGLKQGYWQERKKYSTAGLVTEAARKDKSQNLDSVSHTVAEGSYRDGKRIGTWRDYGENWHLVSVQRELTYLDDGSVVERNFIEKSKIKFNADSTKVSGYIVLDGDTISMACKNGRCSFSLGKGKEFLQFGYNDKYSFTYNLNRLKMGMYSGRIIEIKTNR